LYRQAFSIRTVIQMVISIIVLLILFPAMLVAWQSISSAVNDSCYYPDKHEFFTYIVFTNDNDGAQDRTNNDNLVVNNNNVVRADVKSDGDSTSPSCVMADATIPAGVETGDIIKTPGGAELDEVPVDWASISLESSLKWRESSESQISDILLQLARVTIGLAGVIAFFATLLLCLPRVGGNTTKNE